MKYKPLPLTVLPVYGNRFSEAPNLELYNLKDDVSESTNLADAEPEKTKQMLTLLDNWRRKVKADMPVRNPETFS
jgi:hypothetical protein